MKYCIEIINSCFIACFLLSCSNNKHDVKTNYKQIKSIDSLRDSLVENKKLDSLNLLPNLASKVDVLSKLKINTIPCSTNEYTVQLDNSCTKINTKCIKGKSIVNNIAWNNYCFKVTSEQYTITDLFNKEKILYINDARFTGFLKVIYSFGHTPAIWEDGGWSGGNSVTEFLFQFNHGVFIHQEKAFAGEYYEAVKSLK